MKHRKIHWLNLTGGQCHQLQSREKKNYLLGGFLANKLVNSLLAVHNALGVAVYPSGQLPVSMGPWGFAGSAGGLRGFGGHHLEHERNILT